MSEQPVEPTFENVHMAIFEQMSVGDLRDLRDALTEQIQDTMYYQTLVNRALSRAVRRGVVD